MLPQKPKAILIYVLHFELNIRYARRHYIVIPYIMFCVSGAKMQALAGWREKSRHYSRPIRLSCIKICVMHTQNYISDGDHSNAEITHIGKPIVGYADFHGGEPVKQNHGLKLL